LKSLIFISGTMGIGKSAASRELQKMPPAGGGNDFGTVIDKQNSLVNN